MRMKKRLYKWSPLVVLILLLLSVSPVLASDTSEAEYYGTIVVSNDSTAASNVATVFTGNTTAWIDVGLMNSTANNTAIVAASGADILYMPGYSGNPWCLWVPSISADTNLTDVLYMGGTTNMSGAIRYFPGSGGMVTSDAAALEFGDNFTYEFSGYIDTDLTPSYTTENTTLDSGMIASAGITELNFDLLFDANPVTQAFHTDAAGPGAYLRLDFGSGNATALTQWAYYTEANVHAVWNIQYSDNAADWTTVFTGLDCTTAGEHIASWNYAGAHRYWQSLKTDAAAGGNHHTLLWTETTVQNVDPICDKTGAIRIYPDNGDIVCSISSINATASSVTSGLHLLEVWADTSYLHIAIDGVESDNTSLSGISVPDNDVDWIDCDSGATPYVEYVRKYVDGVLEQYVIWENGATFTDLSGNNHDATPTFRGATSDADVTAELLSFSSISEADAPAYTLTGPPDFITTTPGLSGSFSTTVAPTYPGRDVIKEIAIAGQVPEQLPTMLISTFILIVISLGISYILRKHGSGALVIKVGVILAIMGVYVALGIYDMWQLYFFFIMALGIMWMSRQREVY